LLRGGSVNPLYPEIECLVLEVEKSELESKLAKRIDEMFHAGWIEEVQMLIEKYSSAAPALNTVGYVEIVDYLQGSVQTLDALKSQILIRHRQLAKQQRTWLRSLLRTR
jgi:tRNA dimethylallyltransferase